MQVVRTRRVASQDSGAGEVRGDVRGRHLPSHEVEQLFRPARVDPRLVALGMCGQEHAQIVQSALWA